MEWINWIKCNKDIFSALQNITTIVAIIVAAILAIPRLKRTRPAQRRLAIQISANAIRLTGDQILLHINAILKNVGTAMFPIDDYEGSKYRSWIRIYGIGSSSSALNICNGQWFEWGKSNMTKLLYDGWFTDAPHLELEGGEEENLANDLIIFGNFAAIHVWIKVFEKSGEPYFWSTKKTYALDQIIYSKKNEHP